MKKNKFICSKMARAGSFFSLILCFMNVNIMYAINNSIDRILSSDYDISTIKIMYEKKVLNADIIFICDHKSNIFLIKKPHMYKPISVIKEYLGAWIAEKSHIPANLVRIIPVKSALAVKLNLERPATIHTLVPGKAAGQAYCPACLNIRQTLHGPPEERGLTYKVVHNMSFHSDLPRIVALDTFISNHDRNKKNFFYDKKSDSFFAIDFGGTFKESFASLASVFIKKIIKEKFKLNHQELHGLTIYHDTLKKLIEMVKPEDVMQKINDVVPLITDLALLKELNLYKVFLKNYIESKRLLHLLDELFKFYPDFQKNQYVRDYKLISSEYAHDSCDWCQNMYENELLKECSDKHKEYVIERMCAYQSMFCGEK